MTFAFGMNERFVPSFDHTDAVIRFALMDKKGSGKTFAQQAAEIDRIRKHPNVTIAVGHHIEINQFDRGLAELDKIVDEAHVIYVHTKYMVVDPLGPVPIVVIGSANFSAASTTDNDENMLMIRGNAAVADIYLGEFIVPVQPPRVRRIADLQGRDDPGAGAAAQVPRLAALDRWRRARQGLFRCRLGSHAEAPLLLRPMSHR